MARGATGAFHTLDSIHVAGRTTGDRLREARSSGEYGETDANIRMAQAGAMFSQFGQSVGQKIGDAANKAAFGTERQHWDKKSENTEGFWKIGQQVMVEGRQRIATAEDVKKNNSELAEKNANKSYNNSLNKYRNKHDEDRKIPRPENNGY